MLDAILQSDITAYVAIYLVLAYGMWALFPQKMARLLPRDHRTHKIEYRFTTVLTLTVLWPMAMLSRI